MLPYEASNEFWEDSWHQSLTYKDLWDFDPEWDDFWSMLCGCPL